jgi:hypothetical protein
MWKQHERRMEYDRISEQIGPLAYEYMPKLRGREKIAEIIEKTT